MAYLRPESISNNPEGVLHDLYNGATYEEWFQQVHDFDAYNAYLQSKLQYEVGEQNYQRSLASNQVAQLMAAGMSRSAALAALQSGSNPQTAVSPNPTSMEQNAANRFNNILNSVGLASNLAQQIIGLASVPFDFQAKITTNSILKNQSQMLDMQLQGMQDAASFMQASSNAQNFGVDLSSMQLSDQIQYFQSMANAVGNEPNFHLASSLYGKSPEFKRALSNPYFWSTLQSAYSNQNAADASMFLPQNAEQEVSRLRAATSLVENQSQVEQLRSRILSNDAFISDAVSAARKDMELAKIRAEELGYKFDSGKLDTFIKHLEDFTALDLANLDFQIERIHRMNDPILMQKEFNALSESYDYQSAMYLYNTSLMKVRQGTLDGFISADPKDPNHLIVDSQLKEWCKIGLQYNELGYDTYRSLNQGAWRTVFSGVTAAGVTALAGLKIFSGVKSLFNPSPYVTSSTFGLAPIMWMNGVTDQLLPYNFNGNNNVMQ